MKTDLAVTKEVQQWSAEDIQLIKDTVCKGATDSEFKVFCYAVKRTGLDPFMKQIYAVKRWNNKLGREEMAIQTGIDGFRLIAHRTEVYAGIDAIQFDDDLKPTKAIATVYRIVQGVRCGFTGTARWSEYCPAEKSASFWKRMPCVMLGKVAESIALRMAFPAELSGIYTSDEMAQADSPKEENPKEEKRGRKFDIQTIGSQPSPLLLEMQKIKKLRTELGISEDELKAEVHKMFFQGEISNEDPRKMLLPDLVKISTNLETEQKLRIEEIEAKPLSETFEKAVSELDPLWKSSDHGPQTGDIRR